MSKGLILSRLGPSNTLNTRAIKFPSIANIIGLHSSPLSLFPELRVLEDNARSRPQCFVRVLRTKWRFHHFLLQGQDNKDVGSCYRVRTVRRLFWGMRLKQFWGETERHSNLSISHLIDVKFTSTDCFAGREDWSRRQASSSINEL